nr:hypothetical protein [Tanacetum cinerariifolium]
MQTTEEKVDTSKALDASSVDTDSSRTESKEQDTSSRSGNDAHADDADIRPIYDEEPMAEVFNLKDFRCAKTMTPRSCLRWKPTGKIFKTVGLRWVPTGKIFTSSTTKVDSEPLNGSNADITNQYECERTLNLSAGLVPQRQKAADYDNPDPVHQRQDVYSSADADVPSQQEFDMLFGPLYDEFFNADCVLKSVKRLISSDCPFSKERGVVKVQPHIPTRIRGGNWLWFVLPIS